MRARWDGPNRKAEGERNLAGQVIDGRYRVECQIGSGGMGIVWRVKDTRDRRLYALKTLRDDAFQNRKALHRFIQEARATAAISSQHVVRIVQVNPDCVHQSRPLPYIVMELLKGESFADYLEARAPIEKGELLWVTGQVSLGLSTAHDCGIVHRDLKPSNVFLAQNSDGRLVAKLCDFGNAKVEGWAAGGLAENSVSTETGVVYGTPRYMAPEQLVRHGCTSPMTDQWAFALIVYRALTGTSYFSDARNGAELVLAIVHDKLAVPSTKHPSFPAELDDWFLRSCARDPSGRFPSIAAQQTALMAALGSTPPKPITLSRHASIVQLKRNPESPPSSYEFVIADQPPLQLRALSFYVLVGIAAIIAVFGGRRIQRYELGQLAMRERSTAPRLVAASVPTAIIATWPRTGATNSSPVPTPVTQGSAAPKAAVAPPRRLSNRTRPESASKQPIPTSAGLLPRGASCTRSAECEERLCVAEICQ